MLENIEVLFHSSIRINKGEIIYIDPYKIDKNYNDADIIFVTHDHFDHFSQEDILKVKKEDTIIVVTKDLVEKSLNLGFERNSIIDVEPNELKTIGKIKFKTIPSYNTNKDFHPKSNGWVGYILEINNVKYYIAGDTDITEENKKVQCDVAFVPVGGTYTMNYKEAADLINIINPKIAVPIHYGSVAGEKADGQRFVKLLNSNIEGKVLMSD